MTRGQNSLTVSAKSSIIDVRLGSKCALNGHATKAIIITNPVNLGPLSEVNLVELPF